MFERRLKIFLALLVLFGLVLFGRAFTLQVLGRDQWEKAEHRLTTRPPELTETPRGRILDRNGAPLAIDTACTDVVVDYRAIIEPPDAKWVEKIARDRLRARYGSDFSKTSTVYKLAERKQMLADAEAKVVADVGVMWDTLALLYHPADAEAAALAQANPRAAMDDVRGGIVRQVEMRRRLLWTESYDRTKAREGSGRLSRWLGLTAADPADVDPANRGPDGDAHAFTTEEQESSHVILHALDADGCNFLGKHADQLPGLTLRPSTHRFYPRHDVACHLLGQTAGPTTRQVKESEQDDIARRYEASETNVGREGVEALCEPLLRGTRGRIDRRPGDNAILSEQKFVAGRDVRLSIDADLQARAQYLLQHVVETVKNDQTGRTELITPEDGVSMHAAAVVIDVKTNEVRALASNPTFDVNDLETRFAALNSDEINAPLTDRATVDAIEPGSTVKPMVGLSAVTDGKVGPLEGIECTGFVMLPVIAPDGTRTSVVRRLDGAARCWVESERGAALRRMGMSSAHHPIPGDDPHKGHDGNRDGFLTLSDALERSCDVYFETVADRMGMTDLCGWYDKWGLGRPTGIGIYERPGMREDQGFGKSGGIIRNYRQINCLAGMGQGKMLATPLQIANAAAAIARGGIWMRPRLLSAETQDELDAVHPSSLTTSDSVDLHLNPAAIEQARLGMRAAFERPAGTGHMPHWTPPPWLTVACKTGTADTSAFTYNARSPDGRIIRPKLGTPVVRGQPETATPWYRTEFGHNFVHAWYMGYAPAENPQVAFAVVIEYAGAGGGTAAGPVAAGLLDACVAHGYLHPPGAAEPTTGPSTNP